jgi:hypothetical protein
MLKVEIDGGQADHYRAYGLAKMMRSPTIAEHVARANSGGRPYRRGDKVEYDIEQPLIEDEIDGTPLRIGNKGKRLTKIVFYRGKGDETTVVGSVDVDGAGPFDIELVERPADPEE